MLIIIKNIYKQITYDKTNFFDKNMINICLLSGGSLSIGTIMQIQVQYNEKYFITNSKIKIFGCGYAIAICYDISNNIINKKLYDIKRLQLLYLIKKYNIHDNKLYLLEIANQLITNDIFIKYIKKT
jgi:NifU-like protein involved in Fe-S cluster formation